MMAGTVADRAHTIVNVFSRSSRNRKPRPLKNSIPTSKAENERSPMAQEDELPEPEAEVPTVELMHERPHQEKKNGIDKDQLKEGPPLFPWEFITEDGRTNENIGLKEKILELAIYRRTFVEPADGEEDYVFDYTKLKVVARELLLSNPSLREKRETLVEAVPVPVVTEETFWRNYFLRCNSIRVAECLPSYLPEVKATHLSTGPFAKLRRRFFSKKISRDFCPVYNTTIVNENNLRDLELDVDGEIEKELVKRRPSRAIEMHLQPMSPVQAKDVESAASIEADKSEKVDHEVMASKILDSMAMSKVPEDTPDANSWNMSKEDEEQASIFVN